MTLIKDPSQRGLHVFCRYAAMAFLIFWLLCGMGGCLRSRVIKVNVINGSTEKLSNIVIDYPGATFGIPELGPGKTFQYPIKPTENGAIRIQFRNARGIEHNYPGPIVHKNDEGSIEIKLTQDAAVTKSN